MSLGSFSLSKSLNQVRFSNNGLPDSQLQSLLKARRYAGLPQGTLYDHRGFPLALPTRWQPDPHVLQVLQHLRAGDTEQTVLDLSNRRSEDGDALALALAAVLPSNTTLTSLRLCSCGIGPLGVGALAWALQSNATLDLE